MSKGMDNNRVPDVLARIEVVEKARVQAAPARKAENAMRRQRALVAERWDNKAEGTAQTHEHAARSRDGALARLHSAGKIDAEQLGWALEIGDVAEAIERDVAVRVVSYEPRIDVSAGGGAALVEGIMRVRREMAYGRWRIMLPMPKRLVLDMLVGEPIAFSTAARRFNIHPRKARRELVKAIDRWPECVDWAHRQVDRKELAAAHEKLRE